MKLQADPWPRSSTRTAGSIWIFTGAPSQSVWARRYKGSPRICSFLSLSTPPAAAPAEQKTEEKIGELSRAHSAANVRKPRALRPSVSARDSKVEKTDQPLRVVKRRIDTGAGNPEALSRQVVEELAVRIANSRIK